MNIWSQIPTAAIESNKQLKYCGHSAFKGQQVVEERHGFRLLRVLFVDAWAEARETSGSKYLHIYIYAYIYNTYAYIIMLEEKGEIVHRGVYLAETPT